MSTSPAFAETPKIDSKTNLPRTRGQTRIKAGQLEYLDLGTGSWVYATRLQSIRQRIIQQSLVQGNGQGYTFPKSHGNINGQNPSDYTSFLLKDQQYGEDRSNRNPILFQLRPTHDGQRPTGYVMDNGRIVLDAFDHGIRDFGDDLPLCLSSQIDGWDVETYLRQNLEISYYDIIARMPNDYLVGRLGKRWHSGPPRVGTISMRATRFRLKAGCLAWTEKGDTVAKNNKILSLMPAVCQATNSSQGFRDLTKEEANDCETAKGMRANKGRKSNRQANIAEETDSEDDGVNEDHDDRSSRVIAQADNRSQTVYEDGEEDVNPEDEGFNTAIWPTQNDDDHQMTAISSPESKGALHGGSSYDVKIKKSKKRARAQRSESADSEADTYQPAPKRQRFGKVASEKFHAFRQDQPDDNEIDDHEVATRQQQPRHSKTDATSNAKNGQPDSGGSDGLKRRTAASVQTASKVKTKTRLPSDKTQTLPKKLSKLTPSPTANQTGPGIDIKGMSQYGAPGARLLDPDSAEYAKVSCAAIERGDYRYFLPAVPGARINAIDQVQRALGLTVIDYVQKSGKVPPGGLIKNHLRESYASQWLRLQGAFNECFDDQEPPRLFALPEWHDGFDCWGEVLDEEGAKLWRLSIGEAEIQRTA